MPTKYIKTKDKKIIIFSSLQLHSDFKEFNPVSAGFIYFNINENKQIKCKCYGNSTTLKLDSELEDTLLAQSQILNLL